MENKTIYHILAISGIILLLIVFLLEPICIFKKIFSIPCISCGMTRAIVSILELDFVGAIKYNILSIPLLLTVILFYILYILYLFGIRNYLDDFHTKMVKYYKLIIFILLITWVINVVNYL